MKDRSRKFQVGLKSPTDNLNLGYSPTGISWHYILQKCWRRHLSESLVRGDAGAQCGRQWHWWRWRFVSPVPAPASNSASLWTMSLFSIESNFPLLFPLVSGQISGACQAAFTRNDHRESLYNSSQDKPRVIRAAHKIIYSISAKTKSKDIPVLSCCEPITRAYIPYSHTCFRASQSEQVKLFCTCGTTLMQNKPTLYKRLATEWESFMLPKMWF